MRRFPQTSAVVLAGGEATRLGGGEKALVLLDGRTFLERIAETLHPVFGELLVVTPRPEPLAAQVRDYRVVKDVYRDAGPLGGLHAGLAACAHPRAFVAACDLPLLDRRVAAEIAHRASVDESVEVVLPGVGGRRQPLHAVWSASLAGPAERLLRGEGGSMADLLEGRRVVVLDEAAFTGIPGWERSFFNVNTPDDLERARRLLEDGPVE